MNAAKELKTINDQLRLEINNYVESKLASFKVYLFDIV